MKQTLQLVTIMQSYCTFNMKKINKYKKQHRRMQEHVLCKRSLLLHDQGN